MVHQYFSKWRECWVDFKNQPTSDGELFAMNKAFYQIRYVPDINVGNIQL